MEFIDPGMLHTELITEDAIESGDGAGGVVREWVEVATLFAHVEPVRARMRYGADQRQVDITHRITLRHRDGLFRRMRLRRGERVFAIETITDPDETGRYLVCETRETGR
ncbi:MAG: phage head closure protein [Aliihoeflea sp.]|uniref:phage head closure protein n=1 Tax=Aliihoeflea sp. TaxID=2608088 RepID=UPI0040335CFF